MEKVKFLHTGLDKCTAILRKIVSIPVPNSGSPVYLNWHGISGFMGESRARLTLKYNCGTEDDVALPPVIKYCKINAGFSNLCQTALPILPDR